MTNEKTIGVKMQSQGHRVINNIIIQKMGRIEDITRKMFHEATSREFEKECIESTDTSNVWLKNLIIARLDTYIEDFEFKKN